VSVAAGAAALALAFPPASVLPLAFVGLVPLFRVLGHTRPTGFWGAFRPGLVAGVAFFAPLLYWLVNLSSLDMDNPVLMSGPLLLLVLLESVFWGLFSAAASWVNLRTRVPAWVAFPVLWVACEELRSLGVLGFTWGDLGYAATAAPRAIQFASVTGLFGVSLWIALGNALFAEALSSAGRRRIALACWLAAVLAAPFAHGSLVMRGSHAWPTMRVAVVQPNIDAKRKWDARFRNESFEVLRALSLQAAERGPDLIVWPETAAPSYLFRRPDDMEKVAAVARETGAFVLTGFPDIRGDPDAPRGARTYNSAVLVAPDGVPGAVYDKIHLVPFGEFIPFETVVPALRDVDFGEADFSPGRERVVFEADEARVSVLICFESIFPNLVREFVGGGATLLVNITNDVWYGRTSMPSQHASMAVMRAVENRRSVARSANSGISLLLDPYGRVMGRLGIFERGILVSDLPLVPQKTFFARHGDLAGRGATLLAGLLVLACLVSGGGRTRGRLHPAV
jgi:apolipoprotein N-acyltransferase